MSIRKFDLHFTDWLRYMFDLCFFPWTNRLATFYLSFSYAGIKYVYDSEFKLAVHILKNAQIVTHMYVLVCVYIYIIIYIMIYGERSIK